MPNGEGRSTLAPRSQRLAKTRDIAAWQATMARLDAEQQVARQPRQHQRMAPDEVVAYLRSLPTLWADSGPEGRQALASALFTKLEVEGYQKMRYELTPDAVELGLSAALPAQTRDRRSDRWVWSGREELNRPVPSLGSSSPTTSRWPCAMSPELAALSTPRTGPIGPNGPSERDGSHELGRSHVQVGRSDAVLGRSGRAIRRSRCCRHAVHGAGLPPASPS